MFQIKSVSSLDSKSSSNNNSAICIDIETKRIPNTQLETELEPKSLLECEEEITKKEEEPRFTFDFLKK